MHHHFISLCGYLHRMLQSAFLSHFHTTLLIQVLLHWELCHVMNYAKQIIMKCERLAGMRMELEMKAPAVSRLNASLNIHPTRFHVGKFSRGFFHPSQGRRKLRKRKVFAPLPIFRMHRWWCRVGLFFLTCRFSFCLSRNCNYADAYREVFFSSISFLLLPSFSFRMFCNRFLFALPLHAATFLLDLEMVKRRNFFFGCLHPWLPQIKNSFGLIERRRIAREALLRLPLDYTFRQRNSSLVLCLLHPRWFQEPLYARGEKPCLRSCGR